MGVQDRGGGAVGTAGSPGLPQSAQGSAGLRDLGEGGRGDPGSGATESQPVATRESAVQAPCGHGGQTGLSVLSLEPQSQES